MATTNSSIYAPAKEPRTASRLAILKTWFLQELRLLLRQPVAIFFSLAFPLVIYIFIGLPFAEQEVDAGVRYIDLIFPALLGTSVANLAIMGIPIYLSELRTRKSDIRYRTLPLPLIYFGTALILSMLVLSVLGLLVVSLVIGIAHGLLPAAANPFFWLLIFLMIGWLSSVGFFIGSLPLDARAIQGISAVLFFIMYFGSGAAVPITELPQIMQDVLEWNPLKQWFEALSKVYTGQEIEAALVAKLFIALPLSVASIAGGMLLWKKR